ncbi:MAG: hypothetical protein M9913_00340 [Bryobacteraceae bacterium]|nr:hypothetical protein [Solibacteraceae bacterium]MCO5349354.1 hypothetical protein [Bryobacteraceae bacterium]
MDNPNIQLPRPEEGFDRHEPKSGLIALVSGSVIVVLVGMIVGVYWLYMVAYEKVEFEQYSGVASKDLQAIQEREDAHLYKYSYIDKEKGLVRLPIDRAMELLVAETEAGKVFYNTTAYPAKPEPPGGAAGDALKAAEAQNESATTTENAVPPAQN